MSLSVTDINRLLISVVATICFTALVIFLMCVCWHFIETSTPEEAAKAMSSLIPKAGGSFAVLIAACLTMLKLSLGAKEKVK